MNVEDLVKELGFILKVIHLIRETIIVRDSNILAQIADNLQSLGGAIGSTFNHSLLQENHIPPIEPDIPHTISIKTTKIFPFKLIVIGMNLFIYLQGLNHVCISPYLQDIV